MQTEEEAVEGDVPFGTDYEFRVERVVDGDVRPSERVRVVTGSGSMCGIGPGLVRQGRYRVNASVSVLPSGQRLLHVNSCSGSAQLLAAPPEESSDPDRWRLVGAAGLAAATAGVILIRRRLRPPPSAHAGL